MKWICSELRVWWVFYGVARCSNSVLLFQFAQGPPTSEEFHSIHWRRKTRGGQVWQQPATEYSSSQALPAGSHTERVGEVSRGRRVQGLGPQGQLNHLTSLFFIISQILPLQYSRIPHIRFLRDRTVFRREKSLIIREKQKDPFNNCITFVLRGKQTQQLRTCWENCK